MIRSTVPLLWQKPDRMFPKCWMNKRKSPALSGNGFAIISKSKPHSARKRKTGIDKISGQHQTYGAAQNFLFSTDCLVI